MLKKMNEKKNNKGFSLVELIVVILIMAVLAVALAPQVMKWVGNSRISADVSNYDSLISTCQLALADEQAYGVVYDASNPTTVKYNLTITSTGTKLYDGDTTTTETAATNNFYLALGKVDSNWSSIAVKDGTKTYKIKIMGNGSVQRGTPGTDAPKGADVK